MIWLRFIGTTSCKGSFVHFLEKVREDNIWNTPTCNLAFQIFYLGKAVFIFLETIPLL